ncbi:MAG: LPS export ABC transporter periplasmic protein LptC [Halanaerobiales bacterium]|nr:LPS export ABC transporter periplasmic protein LptC [Halanaerobiales bacterium]
MQRVFLVLLLMVLWTGLMSAEADTGATDKETVHIRPGRLYYTEDKMEMSEGVIIYKGEADERITASTGVYYQQENKALLKGEVVLEHAAGTINSAEMTALLAENRYIFTNGVTMEQELEDQTDFTLEARELVLNTNDDSFVAEGGVLIKHNNRVLKGDQVAYNDLVETLELTGNVLIEESDGDWIKCDQALFELKTDQFTAENNIELELKISSNS